jgi:hypothetical protein
LIKRVIHRRLENEVKEKSQGYHKKPGDYDERRPTDGTPQRRIDGYMMKWEFAPPCPGEALNRGVLINVI